MLFCGGRQVRKEQKILLELQAQFLSRLQGSGPAAGPSGTARVQADEGTWGRTRQGREAPPGTDAGPACGDPPRLVSTTTAWSASFASGATPRRCERNNISLLRNIGEKEISSLSRKGIYRHATGHMFRPAGRGKGRSESRAAITMP